MPKVVDYCLFFNEKELLELRLNLLKDYVTEFVIAESSHTHSGNKKDFVCKELVKELGYEDRVTVIEIDYDTIHLIPNEIDIYDSSAGKSCENVFSWTRERVQRDGLMSIINQYDNNTVVISSDCDEIINPTIIDYFSGISLNLESNYLKIPLVLLERRADKRLFIDDTPADWSQSMVMCSAKLMKQGLSPSILRGQNHNDIRPVWLTENDRIIQDCGWHFTWMGKDRRKQKAQSFSHHGNMSVVNTLSIESFKEIVQDEKLTEEYRTKCNYVLKDYPVELLPQIIFDLPRVKEFLLP